LTFFIWLHRVALSIRRSPVERMVNI
jgi:hypothetical protein